MSNRAIVAFYSRSGHTRALGLEICRLLKAETVLVDCVELEAERELGLLTVGARSLTHSKEPIKECEMDLEGANLMILGTPVWGGSPGPYMRSLLERVEDLKGLPVVLFATCAYGDRKASNDLREMVRATGGRPMDYHVWRTRKDGGDGLSRVAASVVDASLVLLPPP
ncbi:MAG: NAD(P)H-dependent oxidoreductase [Thermoplasmata archaeon]|nr:NAD(P)H-dependent oxidoreductase [Thermoplasmata archaeon]